VLRRACIAENGRKPGAVAEQVCIKAHFPTEGRSNGTMDVLCNPRCCLTVAIRVMRLAHDTVLHWIVKQAFRLGDDSFGADANEARVAGSYTLGALGSIAQHKDGLPKRGGFLLHPARVSQDEITGIHQSDKWQVVERREKMDARVPAESLANRNLDIGIQMQRIDDFDVAAIGDRAYGPANRLDTRTPILAAVAGDDQYPPAM
jgi:hypothetical protein